ncbi:xylan glycosyltransferase MUCI21-like isoform X2 [Andrographis paniculata]|uniref:xylan glycosyltransferase MUCI21-like isoform X2 n=1 Tax=Andrographis paniculata TaxID=175694 RepID=UPI0021E8D324|nr:xylan glycosyltransferase MUCI21-like isoform X2 [Andrographis paniculata]
MEIKERKKLIFRSTPWIVLIVLFFFYVDLLLENRIHFEQRFWYATGDVSGSGSRRIVEGQQDVLDSLLARLVKEDRRNFEATGFACNSEIPSIHCVVDRPVRIDAGTMTVFVPSDHPPAPEEIAVRPYARQEDQVLMKSVSPVKILRGNLSAPACKYNHRVPAVVFSSGGFVGNVFHEMNEIIIPLYITTRMFQSRAVFVLENYNPKFADKYEEILSGLTSHDIIDPAANTSVHCFPAAVVGLKFHGHLAVNSGDIPTGLTMGGFRQFLRETLNLKHRHVAQIRRPTAMLLSRRTSRRIINEDEVVTTMQELGFRVIVVARAKILSNLKSFARLLNSCAVFVAAHGAGLTNELFLPDGAVVVQVDLIGLNWAAATYYGDPARAMHVRYLRYKIEPEESSLLKIFGGRDHIAFSDPKSAFPVEVGKEVYLNGQNVRINITRFRHTMVEALSLVRESSPL